MTWSAVFVYLFIIVSAILSVVTRKLTIAGAFLGSAIAGIIYYAAGLPGLSMLAAFFIMGITTTSLKKEAKQSLAGNEHGVRTAGQVFANSGLAAMICLLSYLFAGMAVWLPLLVAAVFSAAAADTVSSETGNALGKKYYNILNGRPGIRGANGVISFEGTFFGLLASGVIAIIYGLWYSQFGYTIHIMVAGLIGNLTDSYLGAALENQGYLNNNAINFLNTLAGVLAMILLIQL